MSCSAIVLCGGRGTRVDGADKGLLHYGPSTLVEQALDRIRPQVDDIVISANRNRQSYEKLGFPVVDDTLPDYQGPLAGVQAALSSCRHEKVVVTACDMPNLPGDLVSRLLSPLETCDLSYAWDGERDQYLVAALHRRLADSLAAYLADGNRSVRGWYATLNCARVDFSDWPDAFTNINTLKDSL